MKCLSRTVWFYPGDAWKRACGCARDKAQQVLLDEVLKDPEQELSGG